MQALVTGGAGFIGSHLALRLLEDGHRVRVIDNFATGSRGNLSEASADIELVEGDIRSYERVSNAVRGCDVAFHQAALPSVKRSIEDPLASHAVNVTGTLNLFLAARDAGTKRVVFASSASVYGANPALPKTEAFTPAPISPYAATKIACEHYARSCFEVFGLETVALRYFNVFGPRQNVQSHYSSAVPKFIRAISDGVSPVVFGDGEQTRDFVFVENVVEANVLAATAESAAGLALNVGSGRSTSINQLIAELSHLTGREVDTTHVKPRLGDVRHSSADISLAREALGYHPRVDLREGLERMLAWYHASRAPQSASG